VARNPVTGEVIMRVEGQRLRQPNFFHASLAHYCLRTQIEQERFGRADSPLAPDANAEFGWQCRPRETKSR
jgi:hypothetical protein